MKGGGDKTAIETVKIEVKEVTSRPHRRADYFEKSWKRVMFNKNLYLFIH